MQRVVVKAPAKLNLALDILGVDARGYHKVDMLMQAVSVYERVEIEKSTGYQLSIPGSRITRDDSNTATKAARLFFTELGLLAGARIVVKKVLPIRAGLAGGSADAAAVLVGLNALYGAGLSTAELCELGAQIGADVPFSIIGGTARATGFGEQLQQLKPLKGCWFAIGMPKGMGNSTPVVYAAYDALMLNGGAAAHPDVAACVLAAQSGELPLLAANMANALEAAGGNDETVVLRNLLDKGGALASMMTGSGAAVFGLFDSEAKAKQAAYAMRPYCSHTFAAPPEERGARVVAGF